MAVQGLDARALKRLKADDIDLSKRMIHIYGSRKTNARTLKLKYEQLDVLRLYLQDDRAITSKQDKPLFRGFISTLNTDRFSVIASQVTKKLKTLNHRVTNLKQIRASVINKKRGVVNLLGNRCSDKPSNTNSNNPHQSLSVNY